MSVVLDDIKTLLEVDAAETIYDAQLLSYANSGLAYLANNGVPVSQIEAVSDSAVFAGLQGDDYKIVIAWLELYCIQRFDRQIQTSRFTATQQWMDGEMQNLIYQLKARYDDEVRA
jgi:hypothetical protein